MLEPMITIVMAGMVALVIAAVFGPMLALYDGLDNL
jgi:type II secretory pathway component PulF